jgi:hypothetical protein
MATGDAHRFVAEAYVILISGTGVNAAFEDCVVLNRLIDRRGSPKPKTSRLQRSSGTRFSWVIGTPSWVAQTGNWALSRRRTPQAGGTPSIASPHNSAPDPNDQNGAA